MLRAENAYAVPMQSLVLVMQEAPVLVVAQTVVLRELIRNVIEKCVHSCARSDGYPASRVKGACERFSRRIGIDDLRYLLASQDSIRSSLYWRLMRAFGVSNARIYDTTDDLLAAFRAGEVDVLYHVPLSAF